MELCICVFVSAHVCFFVFIVVCTCVWRVVWGPDVRDHQMRALAKVYTSTTPECQAGGSSVLSCPFCIPRTYYFTLVHPEGVFVLCLWWGWRQKCRQLYIIWGPVPACVFWVVMMTLVMFMMLMAMRTMTSSISHVRACACAYQICRATLRLQLFASWPRWRWCVSQFLNKDFLQNFVSRANWHIFVVYKHCYLTFSGHDWTELTNNVTWARKKATSEWNQGKEFEVFPWYRYPGYSVPSTMSFIIMELIYIYIDIVHCT